MAKENEIIGLKELSLKLGRLGSKVGGKILKRAAMTATLPAMKKAKQAAKRIAGDKPHKTYKGRLVAPGFASRSIARKSIISKDKTSVMILLGVKPEAFYAVSFIELGTKTIAPRPWLEPSFKSSTSQMLERLKTQLRKIIEKEAKK